MKYEMNIQERLMALQILPEKSNIAMMRIMNDLRLALSLTEKEVKKYKFRINPETNNMEWEQTGNLDRVPIEMGTAARQQIVDQLLKLDEAEEITVQIYPLVDIFIKKSDMKKAKK